MGRPKTPQEDPEIKKEEQEQEKLLREQEAAKRLANKQIQTERLNILKRSLSGDSTDSMLG